MTFLKVALISCEVNLCSVIFVTMWPFNFVEECAVTRFYHFFMLALLRSFLFEIHERPFVAIRAQLLHIFISPYYTQKIELFSYTRYNARGRETTRIVQFPDRTNR